MPRVDAQKKPRSEAQLANDERLRNRAVEKRSNVAPVVIRPMVESQEQKVGQDGVREFDKNNEIPHLKIDSPVEIEGARRKDGTYHGQKWAEDMAFANEMLTIMVHESTDMLAHPFPEVWVNGRVQRFVRGNEQTVRRCFVEKLARLKKTSFGNLKTKDVDGEDVYRYPTATALLYPFVIVNPTQRDTRWLNNLLAEAG